MSILFCTFVVEIRNISKTPKKQRTMKNYRVERRTADKHLLCEKYDFETFDDATEYVNDERFEDFKYGESDDYEYEIRNGNK